MKTIKRVPVVWQVADSIKDYLFSGVINIGDKLPVEKELCEQLGVGRGTVREAFRILETGGYIELKPGRGAFALRTSEPELEDLSAWFVAHEIETKDFLEVRMAIEPMVVRLAIERCSDDEIKKLRQIHAMLIEAVECEDVSQVIVCDENFHASIVQFSKNELFINISKQIEKKLKGFRSRTFHFPKNIKNIVKPHQNILEAFENRDAAAGELFMREHLDKINEDLMNSR